MTNLALPYMAHDLGITAESSIWIVNAYLLAYVVAMPLAGRAADLWGARRLYTAALLLFAAGSLGAGLSRFAGPGAGLDWLIAARIVQGFGGGALVPLSMALASHLFSGRTRAAALGIEGAATFVGMAVGPAYGAWVLLNVSLPVPGLELKAWQWIFFLNVPVALVVLLLVYVVAGGVETPRTPGRIDLAGGLIGSIGLVAGIGGLTVAGQSGWTAPVTLGVLLAAVVALAAFLVLQLRGRWPLVDPHLFADRRFSASNAVSLLTGYTLATAIIGGPVFVNRVLNAGRIERRRRSPPSPWRSPSGRSPAGCCQGSRAEGSLPSWGWRSPASVCGWHSAGGPMRSCLACNETWPSTASASASPSRHAARRRWRLRELAPTGWRAQCCRSRARSG